jgi:hypothetical protein
MTDTRRRWISPAISGAFGLLAVGATGPGEAMLEEFNRVLNIMVFTAAALALFSLVWSAFTLMWDGQNPSSTSRAKGAAIGALSGLLLTLLAKGIVVLLVGNTSVLLPTR